MSNKPKRTAYYTERGVAQYPKTDQPYRYDQALKRSVPDAEEGNFSLKVILEGEAAEREKKRILKEIAEAGLKKPKNLPFVAEEDKDTGEETGRTIFSFKQYATDYNGAPRRILHVDSRNAKLPNSFRLTGGSEVKVKYTINTYTTLGGGATLYIGAVQVLVLREYEENAGFDTVEDGYTADGFGDDEGGDEPAASSGYAEAYSDSAGLDDDIPF